MLSLGRLYARLRDLAPTVWLPLVALQLLALLVSLVPNRLSGPAQGIAAACVPLVFDPLITGTSLAYARDRALARPTGFTDALALGVRRWPLLVATSFLTVLSAMAPTGWLFALAYGRFATAYTGGAAFIEFALPFAAMILCALPGIYIGVRLFVTVPLVFVETHTPVSAQVRSWKLMAGHFWSAALAYQPLGLAVLVLGAPLALVLAGTPFAALAVPGNPGLAGFVVALRLVGPLGWTLYVIYCLQLLETERSGSS